MTPDATLARIAALSDRSGRPAAASALAQELGVDAVLFFVPDPQLGTLLPAPGLPQTLRGGAEWRAFLGRCAREGDTRGTVDLPEGSSTCALAIGAGNVVAVVLGDEPHAEPLAALRALLPLIGRMLEAELAVGFTGAEASAAREAANRAQALTVALEAARAEHARLNAELRAEDRRKDEFLAMLGHELRNPLTPLLASLEILRHRGLSEELRDLQVEVMARQLSQLTRLVDDLLDVSRVRHGRIELQRQPNELGRIINAAIEASQPVLSARRHELTVTLPEKPLTVDVDHVRMAQVFANLLNNAAKYTDPGGRLAIQAAVEGDMVLVRISDNGIGMSADILPHVFDLFTQGPVSVERSQGGLGIGLTMVKMLVELHGGSVSAESAGLGRGSTITVRLPLTDAPARAAATAAGTAERDRGLRVLVVDDNRDGADSLCIMLKLMGHYPEVAYTGQEALDRVAAQAPDLVLLDIGLPDVDGLEVARRLRASSDRKARLVALTGYGSDEDKRRASEAGFDEHLTKPVAPDVLAQVVARSDSASAAR